MRRYSEGLVLEANPTTGCGSCSTGVPNERSGPTPLERELEELVRRAAAVGSSEVGEHPERREVRLRLDEPLPLAQPLHHRPVDGRHAWVAAEQAALVVLDDLGSDVTRRLLAGATPEEVAGALGWDATSATIGRLAAGGMVEGLTGYRHRPRLEVGRFSRLHLTKACQLECAHCYADSSPHVDRTGELPTERWLRFVDDFAAQGGERVLLTGGEALLHDGCLEVMAAARAAGLHVTLFSNGIRVANRADAIHAHADQVQISMDGPDAASNDAIRGRNAYNHIIRAIDALAERGTPTRVGMTVVPSTWANWVARFDEVRARYAEHPHVTFKLNYGVMTYGRGVDIDPTEVAPEHEVKAFVAQVNGDMSPQITRHRAGCGYGEQVVVGPDGTVYPCHLLDAPMCHLDDMPLPEIVALLGGLARQVDVDHVEGCRTCELRYLCGGSCRVIASRQTGSRLVTDCTPEAKAGKYRNLVASFGAG